MAGYRSSIHPPIPGIAPKTIAFLGTKVQFILSYPELLKNLSLAWAQQFNFNYYTHFAPSVLGLRLHRSRTIPIRQPLSFQKPDLDPAHNNTFPKRPLKNVSTWIFQVSRRKILSTATFFHGAQACLAEKYCCVPENIPRFLHVLYFFSSDKNENTVFLPIKPTMRTSVMPIRIPILSIKTSREEATLPKTKD